MYLSMCIYMSTCNVGKKLIRAYVYCFLYARLKIKLSVLVFVCICIWAHPICFNQMKANPDKFQAIAIGKNTQSKNISLNFW